MRNLIIIIGLLMVSSLKADIIMVTGPIRIVINAPSGGSSICGKLLLENGSDSLLKEDGSTFLDTECGGGSLPLNLLLENGSDKILLEDGASKLQAEH